MDTAWSNLAASPTNGYLMRGGGSYMPAAKVTLSWNHSHGTSVGVGAAEDSAEGTLETRVLLMFSIVCGTCLENPGCFASALTKPMLQKHFKKCKAKKTKIFKTTHLSNPVIRSSRSIGQWRGTIRMCRLYTYHMNKYINEYTSHICMYIYIYAYTVCIYHEIYRPLVILVHSGRASNFHQCPR